MQMIYIKYAIKNINKAKNVIIYYQNSPVNINS